LRIALTFVIFCCTLVIFRCETVAAGGAMVVRLFVPVGGRGLPLHPMGLCVTLGVVAVGHALARNGLGSRLFNGLPVPVRGFAYGLVLTLAWVLMPDTSKAFIYYQF
jgi:hypothetical protein